MGRSSAIYNDYGDPYGTRDYDARKAGQEAAMAGETGERLSPQADAYRRAAVAKQRRLEREALELGLEHAWQAKWHRIHDLCKMTSAEGAPLDEVDSNSGRGQASSGACGVKAEQCPGGNGAPVGQLGPERAA